MRSSGTGYIVDANDSVGTICAGIFVNLGAMELLFEYKGCRRQLAITSLESLLDAITTEMKRLGIADAVVHVVGLTGASKCSISSEEPGNYYLQRWSARWGMFVDVVDTREVVDGDRLTVIPRPVGSLSPVC